MILRILFQNPLRSMKDSMKTWKKRKHFLLILIWRVNSDLVLLRVSGLVTFAKDLPVFASLGLAGDLFRLNLR